jgi:hypothetical protein
MAIRILAFAALAGIITTGAAQAQNWNSYSPPGSPWTNYTGPNGMTGNSYHAPGSPWTNTTINGPNGQSRNCTTYRAPRSPWANTTCN